MSRQGQNLQGETSSEQVALLHGAEESLKQNAVCLLHSSFSEENAEMLADIDKQLHLMTLTRINQRATVSGQTAAVSKMCYL